MVPLKVSYSGVRGIYGSALTEAVAYRFGMVFAALMQEQGASSPLLLARDTRATGPRLQTALRAAVGHQLGRIIDLGVMGTPTVQFAMRPFQAGAAVVVTASHNTGEWNGFKFFLGPDNTVLDGAQTRRLFDLYSDRVEPSPTLLPRTWDLPETTAEGDRAIDLHLEEVKAMIDVDRVRARGFHVAVDAGGGAGSRSLHRLLDDLGCRVETVHSVRDSEPSPENIGELARAVKACGCDLGLAQDLDADRLALVSDHGKPIGEDYTLALAVWHLLRKHGGENPVVVKNLSTTRLVDDLVERYGGELVETPVGEINLSRALARARAQGRVAFGGEGNGGVIIPSILLGRDSLVAAALVLDLMVVEGKPFSELVAELPRYHLLKVKVPLGGGNSVGPYLDALAQRFPEAEVSRQDGLRLRFPDRSWLAVRASNTEPVLRVVAESPDAAWTERMVASISKEVAPAGS